MGNTGDRAVTSTATATRVLLGERSSAANAADAKEHAELTLAQIQSAIHSCIRAYFTEDEIVDCLAVKYNVAAARTRQVLRALQAKNAQFFKMIS